jgi:hypothetical protein
MCAIDIWDQGCWREQLLTSTQWCETQWADDIDVDNQYIAISALYGHWQPQSPGMQPVSESQLVR